MSLKFIKFCFVKARFIQYHYFFCIVFILVFILSQSLRAQSDYLRFQRYSVLDGLSQCYVNSIYQDHRGFIWIGTHKGLNRFDGHTFNVYLAGSDSPDSLGSHMVKAIFEDSNNRLWVGSYSGKGGLFLYDRGQDKFLSVFNNPDFCISGKDNRIYDIAEDQSGNLWLGTVLGLICFNPDDEDPEIVVFRNIEEDPGSLV